MDQLWGHSLFLMGRLFRPKKSGKRPQAISLWGPDIRNPWLGGGDHGGHHRSDAGRRRGHAGRQDAGGGGSGSGGRGPGGVQQHLALAVAVRALFVACRGGGQPEAGTLAR